MSKKIIKVTVMHTTELNSVGTAARLSSSFPRSEKCGRNQSHPCERAVMCEWSVKLIKHDTCIAESVIYKE